MFEKYEGELARVSSCTHKATESRYAFITIGGQEVSNVIVPKGLYDYFKLGLGKSVGLTGFRKGVWLYLSAIREEDGSVKKVLADNPNGFHVALAYLVSMPLVFIMFCFVMFIPAVVLSVVVSGIMGYQEGSSGASTSMWVSFAILTVGGTVYFALRQRAIDAKTRQAARAFDT